MTMMVTVVFEVATSNEEEAQVYVEDAMNTYYWNVSTLLKREPMVVSVENIDE